MANASYAQLPMLNALPCYTQKVPDRWIGKNYGETKVVPPRESFNISNNIPFDTNYGPKYALPILPLAEGLGNTFDAPMAHPHLPSTFVRLPYETIQPETIRPIPGAAYAVNGWTR